MDSHAWRLELDRISQLKGMLVSLNRSLEEQVDRQVRHLYDIYANLSKAENELAVAGMLKKRKIQTQMDKTNGELHEDFMRLVRDLSDFFRKEHRDILAIIPKLQEPKPPEAKAIFTMAFPQIGAGDAKDAQALFEFADPFTKRCLVLLKGVQRDAKSLLDENKRIVETYERHITIDRGEVVASISNEDVTNMSLSDLLTLGEKLKEERAFLDGRKDEVSRMLGASLMSDIESLQTSVETSSRLGLDLPMDFSQKLRVLAREAAVANNLTALLSLEGQLETAKEGVGNLLRDRIINMKHEVTQKIVSGGIPTSADVIPQPPVLTVESTDVASLLSAYQKMVEWEGQVKISLKERIEDILDEISVAVDAPEDSGITDVPATRQFLAESKKRLAKPEIDEMVSLYVVAKRMQEDARTKITERIREYIARFQELASSADRVLDYAQLSKKIPKVEELSGTTAFLLQSLNSLKDAVGSGVTTFKSACMQELDAIAEDLQTIKPAYAEIFMPIVVDLEESQARIKKMEDFGKIRLEMRTIKDTILVKAKEAIENLRYRLGVKIRLAAAKLMGAGVEIPNEVQEAISELNSIGVAADNVFQLPSIARKMIEVYEKKISSKVVVSLDASVTKLMDELGRAKSIGVDVDRELEVLQTMKSSPPEELEDAAEAFDKLMNITTSQTLHKKIRVRVDEAYVQLKGALTVFDQQGMSDFVAKLGGLIEKVPAQLEHESKHVNEALEVCLTLANIQEEMLQVIKGMAAKDLEQHDKSIRERSKYYPTIERVYQKHPKDFSKIIYDLDKVKSLEASLRQAKLLDEALRNFNELKVLRNNWVERAEKMDEWHKSLKMFMTGYSPTASADQREKFLDDVTKKIRDTYSREDISTYLSWAAREIAASMSGQRK